MLRSSFLIFVVSLALVMRFPADGATASQLRHCRWLQKTLALYAIMITGAIWEKDVFGKWLFARAFWWEDLFSMLVLALHSIYLTALAFNIGSSHDRMLLALAAYASYLLNAAQFLLKLRAARLQAAPALVTA